MVDFVEYLRIHIDDWRVLAEGLRRVVLFQYIPAEELDSLVLFQRICIE